MNHQRRLLYAASLFLLLQVAAFQPALGEPLPLTAEIRTVEGTPALFLNGKPHSPLMFFGSLNSGAPIPVSVTKNWQSFSTTFIAGETQPNTAVHIRMGGAQPSAVWVNDVRFVDTADPDRNLARSATFADENWKKDWNLFAKRDAGAAATADRNDAGLRVHITNGGQNAMHVHLFQTGHRIEKGHTYRFSARLRADQPQTVELLAVEQGGNWTKYTGRGINPVLEEIERAAKVGVHIHSFGVDMPWAPDDRPPNFSNTDACLDAVLERDPQALLLPRFGMEPPEAWKQRNPTEVMLFDDGTRTLASVASKLWRRDANRTLRKFVEHVEARYGSHVIGYHPCGQHTGEWFFDESWTNKLNGFEPAINDAFREWLRAKYHDDLAALRKAWGDPALTFDKLTVPSKQQRLSARIGLFRDPTAERNLIDWYEYKQVAMVEPLEQFARTIKDATHRQKLVVFFYGYLFDMSGIPRGPQTSGHLAMARMLDCPDVDILCSPISYFDRGLEGSSPFMVPVDSVRLHGKLWLNEDDIRTWLSTPDSGYGRVDTPEQTRWVHTRNFGPLLTRRITCWWMDLPGAGWLNADEIWNHLKTLKDRYDRDLGRPSRYAPEIAVVLDEKSLFHLASNNIVTNPLVFKLRARFNRIGAPVGIYLLSDLVAGRVPDAKLYLFVNPFALTSDERTALTRTVRRDGKFSLWFYGSGFIRDTADAGHMSDLLEFPLKADMTPEPPQVEFAKEDHPLLAGLAGQSFGTPTPVAPLFIPDDKTPGIHTLARYHQSARPAVVAKSGDKYTTVYIGALTAPAAFLRNCARQAGVFLYLDTDDVLQTDGRWLTISATTPGPKRLRLPRPATVLDSLAGELIGMQIKEWTVTLQKGESRLYECMTAP